MLPRTMFTLMFLLVFAVPLAFAGTDCKKGGFFGTYFRKDFTSGSSGPNYIYQLTLNSDGTASQFWTGALDFMITTGTRSPMIGSWACRSDGSLIVTIMNALYDPTGGGDVILRGHQRTTYLFTITDNNTLTRAQARARFYGAADDPTDPNGGSLASLNNSTVEYKRLAASDADLNAP